MDDDGHTERLQRRGSQTASRPRPAPSRRRRVSLRRRRAGALSGIAALALALGLLAGALTASGGSHAPGSRRPAQRPRPVRSAASADAADGLRAAQSAAIDRTLSVTPYVRMAGAQHRELALTFDDGPGPYTPRILRTLTRMHAAATFFEVGQEDRYFAASTAAIVRDGLPIGDHTENHRAMSTLSRADQQRQILEETSKTGDEGAPFPRMFRPPYGRWNETTLRLLARDRMVMVLWSVDTDDWERPGTAAIVDSALRGARPGAIILLHDAGGDRSQTVAALPTIIRGLRRRGYRMVTVPQLLLDNPAPREQHVQSLRGTGG